VLLLFLVSRGINTTRNGAGEIFWEVDLRRHGKRKYFSSKDAALGEAQFQRIRLRNKGLEGFEFTLEQRTDAKNADGGPGRQRRFIDAGRRGSDGIPREADILCWYGVNGGSLKRTGIQAANWRVDFGSRSKSGNAPFARPLTPPSRRLEPGRGN